MLDLVEEALNEVAFAVQGEVAGARLFPVGLRRDDRGDLALFEAVDELIGVVALVAKHRVGVEAFEQQLGLRDIGGLPRRERQRDGVAERIDDRMDLRRQAAARAPDGLVLANFF